MRSKILSIFSLDLRALALMRIGAGIILLVDLLLRAQNLTAHYTDQGILPLEVLSVLDFHQYFISFHALSGAFVWQLFLFLLAALAAVFLIFGAYTKLASGLSWLLLLSLHNRNPFILNGADNLLLVLLFWGMFLPWGKCFSRTKPESSSKPYTGIAGMGYVLFICTLYFFSALMKDSLEWKSEASALYYALSLDQMQLPLGAWLLSFPQTLKTLTRGVYFLEMFGPLLFLIPFHKEKFRLTGIILFTLFHLGIACTLALGLFPWVGIIALLGFLPSSFMDKIEKPLKKIFFKKRVAKRELLLPVYLVRLRDAFLIFIIAFSFFWSYTQLPSSVVNLRGGVKAFAYLLGLDNSWGMFAPEVMKEDGWPILEGITEGGKRIDINRNGEKTNYEKPKDVRTLFRGERWRKLFENHYRYHQSFLWTYYCPYQLNKWNEAHPQQKLKKLQVIFMKELTLPDFQEAELVKDTLSVCDTN